MIAECNGDPICSDCRDASGGYPSIDATLGLCQRYCGNSRVPAWDELVRFCAGRSVERGRRHRTYLAECSASTRVGDAIAGAVRHLVDALTLSNRGLLHGDGSDRRVALLRSET